MSGQSQKKYRPKKGDIVRFLGRMQRVEHVESNRPKIKLVPVRKNGRTGEWIPTSRSYWHSAEAVRRESELLERR